MILQETIKNGGLLQGHHVGPSAITQQQVIPRGDGKCD
jgi:hypothetical protein